MKYLLDTHTLIWFIEGDTALSSNAQTIIEDPTNMKFVSIVSIWEIAIKISLDKLALQKPLEIFLQELVQLDLTVLPLTFAHILELTRLDFYHKDPFDRMIIAQGLAEDLQIITRDSNFPPYRVKLFW